MPCLAAAPLRLRSRSRVHGSPAGNRSSAPVDQISEAVADCAGDEQGCDRLLRRISAYEIACSGALLIEVCRRLRRLIAGFARSTLNDLPGLGHRLPAGLGSLPRQCGGTGLRVLDHGLALLELALHARTRLLHGIARRRADLLRRLGRAVLNSLLIHSLLQRA